MARYPTCVFYKNGAHLFELILINEKLIRHGIYIVQRKYNNFDSE